MGCPCNKKKDQDLSQTEKPKPYTLKDVIIDELLGRAEKVDQETFTNRVLICSACPRLIRPTFQCGKCKCFIRKKARYSKSQCPLTIEEDGEGPRWFAEDGGNPPLNTNE